MAAALSIIPAPLSLSEAPPTITLLDLVVELSDTGASDREVVAAVMDLLETSRVKLVGQICEEHLLAAI